MFIWSIFVVLRVFLEHVCRSKTKTESERSQYNTVGTETVWDNQGDIETQTMKLNTECDVL